MKEIITKYNKVLLILILSLIIGDISLLVDANTYKKKLSNTSNLISYNYTEEQINVVNTNLVDNFIPLNIEKIDFYANIFCINKEVLINKLKENYENIKLLDSENIDDTLIRYLLKLEKEEKKLFNNEIKSNKDSKEYMVALIKYFTTIYPEVDFNIAAAIAEIESGYRSKFMLSVNNIFGGMSGGKLIRYKNIEYGILRFVLLLNDGYFKKGLKTVNEIGYVYNPVTSEDGKRMASPTWVVKVNNATNHYNNIETLELNKILELKNNVVAE